MHSDTFSPPSLSNEYLSALSDDGLRDLYWSLFDTRGLVPAHLRATRDTSPQARAWRRKRANAQGRIRALAARRGVNLQRGRVYEQAFPPVNFQMRNDNEIEIGDTVRSKFHGMEGTVVEISYSDKRVGRFVIGWMYMVQFDGRAAVDACHKTDLTLVRKGARASD